MSGRCGRCRRCPGSVLGVRVRGRCRARWRAVDVGSVVGGWVGSRGAAVVVSRGRSWSARSTGRTRKDATSSPAAMRRRWRSDDGADHARTVERSESHEATAGQGPYSRTPTPPAPCTTRTTPAGRGAALRHARRRASTPAPCPLRRPSSSPVMPRPSGLRADSMPRYPAAARRAPPSAALGLRVPVVAAVRTLAEDDRDVRRRHVVLGRPRRVPTHRRPTASIVRGTCSVAERVRVHRRGVPWRHVTHVRPHHDVDPWRSCRPGAVPWQGPADRQRRESLRPHWSVRRSAYAPGRPRRPRLQRPRLPVQPVRAQEPGTNDGVTSSPRRSTRRTSRCSRRSRSTARSPHASLRTG